MTNLTETDYENITARFKAALFEAAGPGGSLPCARHEARLGRLEINVAKAAVILGLIAAVAGFLGSAAAGVAFDRAAATVLTAPSAGGP